MKKLFSNLLFIAVLFFLLVPGLVSGFSGGSGTSGDPWQISSVSDLVEVANYNGTSSTAKHFKLMADLDLNVSPYNTGSGWIMLGTSANRFYGTFDGNGYTISNLYLATSTQYAGFFGYVQAATIKNLGLVNANVTSSHASASLGILIGGGTVTSTNNYTTGMVSSTYSVGGLIGTFSGGTVSSSYSSARVYGNGLGIGGLIGNVSAGSIYSSYATGTVTGNSRLGGFAGSISGSAVVSSSYATGNVSGTSGVGGFVGHIYQAYVYNSYATGNATNTGSWTGGFAGFSQGASLVGGTHVSSTYATGNVSGSSACGGFVGYTEYLSVTDSYTRGQVTCSNTGGGFAGSVWGANFRNIYATGLVSVSGGGGLVGSNSGGGFTTSSLYWDRETTGKTTSVGNGSGLTTAQMKDSANLSGFDFTNIWNIDGSNNDGYAFLRVQNFADVTAPTLSSVFPVDNASSVTTTANLVMNFSEAMSASSTGAVTIYNSDGSVFERITPTSGQVSGTGTVQIVINPATAFTSQAAYFVLVSSTAFTDASGNAYGGISSTTIWSFTVADEAAPTLSSVFPVDNASSVTTTANLVMNFSETISTSTGAITIYNSNGTEFERISTASALLSGAGTTQVVIDLGTDFSSGVSYYVLVSSTAFVDGSGNAYAGIVDSATWNFAIVAAAASSESPASGSGGVAAFVGPPSVGSGRVERKIGMHQNGDIGVITVAGTNYLSYVGSDAGFATQVSRSMVQENYRLVVDALDLFDNTVSFTIRSETQKFSIAMGESVKVDLDGDSVQDVSVTFVNVWQNRLELTLTSLLDMGADVPELEAVGGEQCLVLFAYDMRVGQTDTLVTALQKYLNTSGYLVAKTGFGAPGNESTYFGIRTQKALVSLQKKNGLIASGVLNSATREFINCGKVVTPIIVPISVAAPKVLDTASVSLVRNLERGMAGDDVRELQKNLNRLGYAVVADGAGSEGLETGYFGEATKQALIRFQKAHNVPAFGYYGALTRRVMK